MKKEFKQEFERAEGRTEQWCAVKRLEVSFEEFIKKLKENFDNLFDGSTLQQRIFRKQIDTLSGEFK